jgi:hypothetical protein
MVAPQVTATPVSAGATAVDGLVKGAQGQSRMLGTLGVKPMLASAGSKDAAQPRKLQSTVVARSLPGEGDLYEYLMNHPYSSQNDNEDALSYLRVVSYATAQ